MLIPRREAAARRLKPWCPSSITTDPGHGTTTLPSQELSLLPGAFRNYSFQQETFYFGSSKTLWSMMSSVGVEHTKEGFPSKPCPQRGSGWCCWSLFHGTFGLSVNVMEEDSEISESFLSWCRGKGPRCPQGVPLQHPSRCLPSHFPPLPCFEQLFGDRRRNDTEPRRWR